MLLLHKAVLAATRKRGVKYLNLTGTSGHFCRTPDSVSVPESGTIDVRVLSQMSTPNSLMGPWENTKKRFYLLSSNQLVFSYSLDGSANNTHQSTVTWATTGRANTEKLWRRAVHVCDAGGGNRTTDFYYSTEINVLDGQAVGTWTQLGSQVTSADAGNLFSTDSQVELGAVFAGTANISTGKIYRGQIIHNSSLVFDMNPADWVNGTTFISALTGETYTMNGFTIRAE